MKRSSDSRFLFLALTAAVGVFGFCLAAQTLRADTEPKIDLEVLRKTEAKIKDLSRRVLPCTVALIPGGESPRFGTGSGVVVSADGLILTAAHVAIEMNEKVTVIFPNGDRANADVLGMDFSRDAAMLQITDRDKGEFAFVELGDSKAMKRNEWCIALGHAGGFSADRTPPVRLGRVIENDAGAFLISDSALIGGDSGGPLFDIEGELIGIHSNIGFSLDQNRHVPISVFVENWEKLKSGVRYGGEHLGGMLQNPDRPVIGALLEDAKDAGGAFVRSVVPGSPADKAGLKTGDTIVQIGPTEIKEVGTLMGLVDDRKVGDTLRMTVRNGEQERGVAVKLVAARALQSKLESDRQPPPRVRRRPGDAEPPSTPPAPKPKKAKSKAKAEDSQEKPESGGAAPKVEKTSGGSDGDKKQEAAAAAKDGSDDDKTDSKLQAEFDLRMRESIQEGDLNLSDKEFEKFGGADGFAKLLREFQKKLTPEDIADLMRAFERGARISPESDPDQPLQVSEDFFREVLDSLRPLAAAASDATHLVFRGSEWKCFCTVVRADGYAVTKFSEIDTRNNQALNVLLEKGRLVSAEIVHKWPEYDLALIKLDTADGELPAVRWHRGGEVPELGSFLAAVGSGPDPIAIGVVSVLTRAMSGGNKGFLGVGIETEAAGVRITRLQPDGAAMQGGLKAGDVITKIGDSVIDTGEKLQRLVTATTPGETIVVHFLRDGKTLKKDIVLGDREALDDYLAAGDRADRMNRFGTEISKTSYGFQRALQSDLPIRPEQCGGPVIDLNGEVVGINIARAGRIKTYMLVADDVARVVEEALAEVDETAKEKAPARK